MFMIFFLFKLGLQNSCFLKSFYFRSEKEAVIKISQNSFFYPTQIPSSKIIGDVADSSSFVHITGSKSWDSDSFVSDQNIIYSSSDYCSISIQPNQLHDFYGVYGNISTDCNNELTVSGGDTLSFSYSSDQCHLIAPPLLSGITINFNVTGNDEDIKLYCDNESEPRIFDHSTKEPLQCNGYGALLYIKLGQTPSKGNYTIQYSSALLPIWNKEGTYDLLQKTIQHNQEPSSTITTSKNSKNNSWEIPVIVAVVIVIIIIIIVILTCNKKPLGML